MIVVEEFDLGIIDFPQKVKSKEKDLHAMVTRFPFLPVAIARQRCEPQTIRQACHGLLPVDLQCGALRRSLRCALGYFCLASAVSRLHGCHICRSLRLNT